MNLMTVHQAPLYKLSSVAVIEVKKLFRDIRSLAPTLRFVSVACCSVSWVRPVLGRCKGEDLYPFPHMPNTTRFTLGTALKCNHIYTRNSLNSQQVLHSSLYYTKRPKSWQCFLREDREFTGRWQCEHPRAWRRSCSAVSVCAHSVVGTSGGLTHHVCGRRERGNL